MKELLVSLGKRVKELRSAKGWSQEEFAHVCGLHRTYIGQIERGEKNISFGNLGEAVERFGRRPFGVALRSGERRTSPPSQTRSKTGENLKKLAQRARLDASKHAGHSLRAGHATAAAIAGASERSIMNQTGHRSVQMVRRYIRDGSLFRENSAGKLGL